MTHDPRPIQPEAPLPDDCCGCGCMPCILDSHDEAMREYHRLLLAWMVRHPPVPGPVAPSTRTRPPLRVVLDTNVSLDLIVFRDPRWRPLRETIERGECEAMMRADCRTEFARVLEYPQFDLDPGQRVRALQAFDGLHRMVDPQGGRDEPSRPLPQCRDPDDQKFLELALQADADILLSKDKAVLKLARRNRREGLFEILSPQAWVDRDGAPAPAT
jgi:putative PIN family toxin of toxin-antitoxin system